LLTAFGGHEGACGLSIEKQNIDDFRKTINRLAGDMFEADISSPKIYVDLEISLSKLNKTLIQNINRLAPFGIGNPKPVIASRSLRVVRGPVFLGRRGIKFWVSDGNTTCEAVDFRSRQYFDIISKGDKIALAYNPNISDWRGIHTLRLNICDFKIESKMEQDVVKS
jgi:single-stranded-DNA-specific exonuclease